MSTKFGILAKLDFLQTIVSYIVAKINPAIVHNIDKYIALKKAIYLTGIEELDGDYLEFGVYTGSSFCHAIRCVREMDNMMNSPIASKFIGFDSFEGFGDLSNEEIHPFYTESNFETSYEKVYKRVKKTSGKYEFKLVKGFFENTLIGSYPRLARVVFIDSDTYSSAVHALKYIEKAIQIGSIIILDDYFSYKGSTKRGIFLAFQEFINRCSFSVRKVCDYGMGGVVFIFTEKNEQF